MIAYTDGNRDASTRIIWPFALVFFDSVRVIAAWCEKRGAFRHFRPDRIRRLEQLEARYPRRRATLLKEWREVEGIPEQ
jgi:predicted DNA-binding transcriptional regulator YafY